MATKKITIAMDRNLPMTEELIFKQVQAAIERLLSVGALVGKPEDFLLGYETSINQNQIILEIDESAYRDGATLLTAGGGLSLDDENYHWWDNKVQLFSTATIKERLRIKKRAPRVQLRYLVTDYKNYWNKKKSSLLEGDGKEAAQIVQMFLADLMQLFNLVLPDIQEGKQLQSLLGLQQVSPSLNKVARELSLAYRKALKSEQTQGAPTKVLYISLVNAYKKFLNALIPIVFEGYKISDAQEEEAQTAVEEEITTESSRRVYSYSSDGRILLFK